MKTKYKLYLEFITNKAAKAVLGGTLHIETTDSNAAYRTGISQSKNNTELRQLLNSPQYQAVNHTQHSLTKSINGEIHNQEEGDSQNGEAMTAGKTDNSSNHSVPREEDQLTNGNQLKKD